MAYDEMELDLLGDRRTALFVIISDTDDTFNFVVSIMYTQLFNLLCDRADDQCGGQLKFNGFLAPKAEGSYLILNEGGYQIEGQTDTWKVIDEKNVQEQRFVQLVCEQTKKQKPDIVLHDSGVLVAQTIYGFDSLVMKKIEKFLREQKPELLHHQKFLENGTAERAKESGTEQNYNMIDGCVNNNPKKPRIIGNRISVLDRLHIKLEERKQKSQPQQQQQQERSRKN